MSQENIFKNYEDSLNQLKGFWNEGYQTQVNMMNSSFSYLNDFSNLQAASVEKSVEQAKKTYDQWMDEQNNFQSQLQKLSEDYQDKLIESYTQYTKQAMSFFR